MNSQDGATTAIVAASYGRHVLIEQRDGAILPARPANRRLRCICGDSVQVETKAGESIVREIGERHSVLWRQDNREGRRPLAANIDCMLILVSPQPGSSPEQLDRYIAVAEICGLRPVLLRGKTDLSDPAFDAMLEEFTRLGYRCLPVSAKLEAGLDALKAELVSRKAVLVGLSGAGKSSLFNALVPDADQRTAKLSAASGEGRHTTTSTLLHRLDCGGWLIDSPGVRDIRLWPMSARELLVGYRDLLPLEQYCRFANCSHRHEPGCGIRDSVEKGAASLRRYESFCDLADRLSSQLQPVGADRTGH